VSRHLTATLVELNGKTHLVRTDADGPFLVDEPSVALCGETGIYDFSVPMMETCRSCMAVIIPAVEQTGSL
jgi:hypothetical protein